MNFGIIYYVSNGNVVVIMEGNEKELSDIIDVIKDNINKESSIKLLDKDEYNEAKTNIQELNRIVLGE